MTDDVGESYPMSNAITIYDYIDGDGDLIALDIVDEEWLALSIIKHGMASILTVVINEPSDARKLASHITEWADAVEGASQ